MPDEAAVKCIWQSIATFLGGSFVGTWLGHFLAIGRDKRNQRHAHDVAREARKNNLLAYLNVWSSEVAANRRSADANNVLLTIAEQFDGKRLEVIRQATPMESDFRGDRVTRFKDLIDKITGMTPGSVEGDDGRQNF